MQANDDAASVIASERTRAGLAAIDEHADGFKPQRLAERSTASLLRFE
jgi:hypothetical protein